jgi:type IV pilus assembly protein PilO
MRRETILITAVGLVLVLAAYVFFGYLPLARQLHARRQVVAAKERELTEIQQLVARYADYQARALRIQLEAQRLEERIPPQPRIPDLLRDITRAATECNLRDCQFVPGAPIRRQGYTEQPVRLKLAGGYHALGLFLTRLASFPRLISAREVSVTGRDKTDHGDSIAAEMTLVTYVLEKR